MIAIFTSTIAQLRKLRKTQKSDTMGFHQSRHSQTRLTSGIVVLFSCNSSASHSHKKTRQNVPVKSVKVRYGPMAKQQCRKFVA